MQNQIEKYLKTLLKLRRAPSKNGRAPHKPILLLAIINLFAQGHIKSNIIYLTPELVAEFKQLWNTFDIKGFNPLIAQPFFHMRSEGFWKLIPNFGFDKWLQYTKQCNSINAIKRAVNRVEIDKELAGLLIEPDSRKILKNSILKTYFNEHKYCQETSETILEKIGNSLIAETPEEYKNEITELEENLDKDLLEEELFLRSGAFKKEILKIYNNSCCISGFNIETDINISLLDACHIVPFSDSHDDTISNGIALCPNLHRAFDRGLITIDDCYRVCVSDKLIEKNNNPYSVQQFNGKKILLPAKRVYYPGITNFRVHRAKYNY